METEIKKRIDNLPEHLKGLVEDLGEIHEYIQYYYIFSNRIIHGEEITEEDIAKVEWLIDVFNKKENKHDHQKD